MKPELYSIKAEYTQDGDTSSNGDLQVLTLQTDQAHDGFYYILSTERWAFDDIDELIATLNDFKARTQKPATNINP